MGTKFTFVSAEFQKFTRVFVELLKYIFHGIPMNIINNLYI